MRVLYAVAAPGWLLCIYGLWTGPSTLELAMATVASAAVAVGMVVFAFNPDI